MSFEKVKELLSSGDYDTIDEGIQVAIDLNDSKIFDDLLDGCNVNGAPHDSRLNDWLKSNVTSSGELQLKPKGYYVWLSLLVNHPSYNLSEIKVLDLTNAYLTKLPDHFSKFVNLKKLNLQKNELEEFPQEVLKLKNLSHLHLGWNKIKHIPDEISDLDNLQSLMIGNNSIETISDDLGNLKNLQHLDIGSNYISDLPSCIYSLKKLININVYNDDYDEFNSHTEELNEALPDCYIIQPVNCNECGDDTIFYRVEDMFDNEYGYVCEGCYEPADLPGYCCECCEIFVAPRGYTGGSCENSGNNKDINEGYDFRRWFIDAQAEYDEGYNLKTIIKDMDGELSDRLICELSRNDIPNKDKPSYEEAEIFAEDNELESWE